MAEKSLSASKSSKKQGKKGTSEESISHVRELAWAGQHAQAIELATQELTG